MNPREGKQIAIANQAANCIGSGAWARDMYKTSIDNKFLFLPGKYTCGLFVYDVIYTILGTAPHTPLDPLTPAEWASSMIVENWDNRGTAEPWQLGDVIAIKIDGCDATGHCGIAVSRDEVMAVDTLRVTRGTHGLTGGTVRRYAGD